MTEEGEVEALKSRRKPARVQVDPETINADDKPPQTGTIFNIWYMKWSNGGDSSRHIQTHSKTRVNIKKDSGYTKADKHVLDPRAINNKHFICLYFARGSCCMGRKCEYLHRLPSERDIFPPTLDCFGREKFSDYRDDMGGVGNFNRVNRTLYVGRINSMEQSKADGSGVEALISQTFAEFGDVERIRVIHSKGIAFVTYRLEVSAQFAKEAMAHQSLIPDNENEILNVRWASDDPDPEAQKREKKRREEIALATVQNLLSTMDEPSAKKQKVEVEEPEELGTAKEPENEEPKALPAPQFFNKDSLSILGKLKATKKPDMQALMAGYGSSDED